MDGATPDAVKSNIESHVIVYGGEEDALRISATLRTQTEAMIKEKPVDHVQYDGYLNQRGTF